MEKKCLLNLNTSIIYIPMSPPSHDLLNILKAAARVFLISRTQFYAVFAHHDMFVNKHAKFKTKWLCFQHTYLYQYFSDESCVKTKERTFSCND